MNSTYRGFSTIGAEFTSTKVTDTDLIKRDLLNHFAIRKGEKLMNGSFGTSLQDLLLEPLTEETKQIVIQEVNTVIENDPRVVAENILLDEYEAGLQIELTVRYATTNEVETMQINFARPAEANL